jgi:hypothetical protein
MKTEAAESKREYGFVVKFDAQYAYGYPVILVTGDEYNHLAVTLYEDFCCLKGDLIEEEREVAPISPSNRRNEKVVYGEGGMK